MTNDQTVTQALEPCPFCGAGDANPNGICSYSKGHEAWWADGTEIRESFFVSCVKCGISNRGMFGHRTRELAIIAWNTRTTHSGEGQGWIVGNADGTKWRCWGSTGPEWTDDHEQAIRYARRIDAERTHADDDDAWRIVPYSGEGRSNGAGEDRLSSALAEHFPTGIRGLYEQSAQRIPVQTHVGTNCLCGWCTSATDEHEVRDEWAAHVAAALAQPEAGGEHD